MLWSAQHLLERFAAALHQRGLCLVSGCFHGKPPSGSQARPRSDQRQKPRHDVAVRVALGTTRHRPSKSGWAWACISIILTTWDANGRFWPIACANGPIEPHTHGYDLANHKLRSNVSSLASSWPVLGFSTRAARKRSTVSMWTSSGFCNEQCVWSVSPPGHSRTSARTPTQKPLRVLKQSGTPCATDRVAEVCFGN